MDLFWEVDAGANHYSYRRLANTDEPLPICMSRHDRTLASHCSTLTTDINYLSSNVISRFSTWTECRSSNIMRILINEDEDNGQLVRIAEQQSFIQLAIFDCREVD